MIVKHKDQEPKMKNTLEEIQKDMNQFFKNMDKEIYGHKKKMKLMTKEIEKKLPALYETEEVALADKELVAKFFTPWSHWTWYAVEYDKNSGDCFGYVHGDFDEWGYFNLEELKKVAGPFGLKIERDKFWSPVKFSELKEV